MPSSNFKRFPLRFSNSKTSIPVHPSFKPNTTTMRPQLSRAQHLASRSTRCTPTKTIPRRSFAQTTRRRTTPHYEPPAPKDSKGNDARLSRFSKILGIAVGSAFAFGYSVYKHKNKTAAEAAGTAGGGVGPGNDGFVKYRLAAREDVSSTCAIFTLRPVLGGKGIGGSGEEEGKGKGGCAEMTRDPYSKYTLTLAYIPN